MANPNIVSVTSIYGKTTYLTSWDECSRFVTER